jgi:hypothetical protein
MSLTNISIQDFLSMIESAEKVHVYEYYDGLNISFDTILYMGRWKIAAKYDHLIEWKGGEQDLIFQKIETLQNLKEFDYTSRFSDTWYQSLNVNKSLKTLHIRSMKGIEDVKQLGNIDELYLVEFGFLHQASGEEKLESLKYLPKTLKIIYISSLHVESKEEYYTIIEYFSQNNIDYYFDDYADWSPSA